VLYSLPLPPRRERARVRGKYLLPSVISIKPVLNLIGEWKTSRNLSDYLKILPDVFEFG